ncbi:MAG: hypothetical protein K2X93_22470 [Candidatus Obscuribacterales bacterium]|nr:hypothetical protein [Candidatus Obscuribacterales bacterium]
MASTMACCMQHVTIGINAPCHCRAQPAPLQLTNTAASTAKFFPEWDAQTVETSPIRYLKEHRQAINVQWLACDALLRAPPVRLYIINCALLN